MEPGKRVPEATVGTGVVRRMAQGGDLAITSDLIRTPTVSTS
jgi:hypothetical protein